ncbi:hypothetical protein KA005_35645, partial [bacterium]|nr:hypothetical protein [bacterium]
MSKVVEQRIASRGGSCLQQWRINAGDSSAMLKVYTNPEYILDAIKAAESICAGDIKGALSVIEVRALKHLASTQAVKAWIPGINVYILGLEIWVAYMDYLNNAIYNINKKQIYDIFRKDKDLWEPQTGINHFITKYVQKNYQVRIFVHEYATNDMKIKMPSVKTQWWLRTEAEGYPNKKTLQVIVAAIRKEMFRYYATEMRVTRARKELLDELKSLKEMYSFIKDQQEFFAKRLKEVQEEMDKVINKNKQLNQNYQNQVANIKSVYPQNPSSKYDYKNQPNEKEEAVRVARILSDNDQLYKSIRKKIDLFQERPLDTIIAQKAYKSSNPNYANKWTLNRTFMVQPVSTGGHGNGIKRYISDLVAWYPKINVVDALIKRQDPSGNWYSEDTFKRELDSLAQKAEDLDKFVKEISSKLKSTLVTEQKHVEGINEQIKLIKLTGYEKWDKEIREMRDKYYVAMLSHDYELDIDEERWENLSSEKKPILKDIESVIGSIEKTTSLGHTLREKFSEIKTASARAAEKLKLWKEKE